MENRKFNVGYVKYDQAKNEDLFLSVTPGFEHGPGIQRDGISEPYMTDPHCVAYVCNARDLKRKGDVAKTTDAFLQRAGTWTIYNHLKRFHDTKGQDGWRIIGAQGVGDLTMNYWHVAYCDQTEYNYSDLAYHPVFCHLGTVEDKTSTEPYQERTYRCLVKWKERSPNLEFCNIHFRAADTPARVTVHLADDNDSDITKEIWFAMSGKTIIENGIELPLDAVIDRFDDVRHIFALPSNIDAHGNFMGQKVTRANFGEYNLFKNLNERRAALHAPVIIPLVLDFLSFDKGSVLKEFVKKHFRQTNSPSEVPTLGGQYREYKVDHRDALDVFFPRNVYPFGLIGIAGTSPHEKTTSSEIICLSSGGLSGRIGNTLEGITRIMYDFLNCSEAMVLDEGLDVFQIANPMVRNDLMDEKSEIPKYSNEEILSSVAEFSKSLFDTEHKEWAKRVFSTDDSSANIGCGLELNSLVFEELKNASVNELAPKSDEIFSVKPSRSQIRAVLIFAKKFDQRPTKTFSNSHVKPKTLKSEKSRTKLIS